MSQKTPKRQQTSITTFTSYTFTSINGKTTEQSLVLKKTPSKIQGEMLVKKNGKTLMRRPISKSSDVNSATKDAKELLTPKPTRYPTRKTQQKTTQKKTPYKKTQKNTKKSS